MEDIEKVISELLYDPGCIVPVIGDNVIYYRSPSNGKEESLQSFLVRKMLEEYKQSDVDESEIQKMATNGYYGISILKRYCREKFGFVLEQVYNQYRENIYLDSTISAFLTALKPSMVITTSPFPVVEQVLKDYTVRVYSGQSAENRKAIADGEHIIYHLFGEAAGKNSVWVKTETDLLIFLHWLHEGKSAPRDLSSFLKTKEMFFLGCSFPDWLFRFLWYSIGYDEGNYNAFNLKLDNDYTSGYWMEEERPSPPLHDFFREINYEAPEKVKMILQCVTEKLREQQSENEKEGTREKPFDLFISYNAKTDEDLCKALVQELIHQGIPESRIWASYMYPEQGDYTVRIQDAIRKSKYFMPVVTTGYVNRMIQATTYVPFSQLDFKGDMDLVSETVFAVRNNVTPLPAVKSGDSAFISPMSYESLQQLSRADKLPPSLFDKQQFFFFVLNDEGSVSFATPLDSVVAQLK